MNKINKCLKDFRRGVAIVIRAIGIFITSPGYWPYALLPWLISLVVYALLAAGFWFYLRPWLGGLIPEPAADASAWYDFLMTVLRQAIYLTATLIALTILIFTYTTIAMLAAAPFMDILAAKFDKDRYDMEFRPSALRERIYYYYTTTLNPLRLGVKAVLWAAILIPLSLLLPYAGFLLPATVIGYYLGATAALYGSEHRRLTYREFKKQLRGSKVLLTGMGMTVYLAMSIPLLAILMLPAAAIAGVIVYQEYLLPRSQGAGEDNPSAEKR